MGVLGILQLDFLKYLLKTEYGVDIVRQPLSYNIARWVKSDAEEPLDYKNLVLTATSLVVLDRDDEPVVLFESEWAIDWAVQHNESKKLRFENIHSK